MRNIFFAFTLFSSVAMSQDVDDIGVMTYMDVIISNETDPCYVEMNEIITYCYNENKIMYTFEDNVLSSFVFIEFYSSRMEAEKSMTLQIADIVLRTGEHPSYSDGMAIFILGKACISFNVSVINGRNYIQQNVFKL